MVAGFAKFTVKRFDWQISQLSDRADAQPVQSLACRSSDSPKSFDRQRREKRVDTAGLNDAKAVRFVQVACDLSKKLVRRDADRSD